MNPESTTRSQASPLIKEDVRRLDRQRPAAQAARVKRFNPGRQKRRVESGRFA
jgi:hypothetical protein